MPKHTCTATCTATYNGQTFIRKSKKVYTHVVIATPHRGHDIAEIHREAVSKSFAQNYWYYCREANDATRQFDHTADEIERFKKVSAMSLPEYRDAYVQERLAKVETLHQAGFYLQYRVVCWCGRADLAVKSAASARKKPWHGDVQIRFVTPHV